MAMGPPLVRYAQHVGACAPIQRAIGAGAAALSLPALFVAPIAARGSTRAPAMVLRLGFALCLGGIAIRILMR